MPSNWASLFDTTVSRRPMMFPMARSSMEPGWSRLLSEHQVVAPVWAVELAKAWDTISAQMSGAPVSDEQLAPAVFDIASLTGAPATGLGKVVAANASKSPAILQALKRAEQQGFEPGWYHGTASDVRGFDRSKAGGVTKARSAKEGTWLVRDPQSAAGYAENATTKPVQDLVDASYAAERRGDWDAANDLMRRAEELEKQGGQGANVMPLAVRGNIKKIDMDGVQYDPEDINLAKMVREARREGYDGVQFLNFSDEAGFGNYRPTDHMVVFDPKNIRSRFAQFDPAKADSTDLLAANASKTPAMLQALKKGEPQGIRAYHGSPHDFDRFSMDKIGTGEGAQAYGHGLYFAENEGVARGYRDTLSPSYMGPHYDGKPVPDAEPAKFNAVVALASSRGSKSRAKQLARESGHGNDVIAEIDALDINKASWGETSPGRMYEVNIKANPDDFLDWDKPLSEQPKAVQEAFSNVKPPQHLRMEAAREIYGTDNPWKVHAGDAAERVDEAARRKMSAEEMLWGGERAPKKGEVEQRLRQAGIKGIRYLDQGSRTAGEGSRNYVVFDDNIIEILKKYGIAGLMAYGGANALSGNEARAEEQKMTQRKKLPEGFVNPNDVNGAPGSDEKRKALPEGFVNPNDLKQDVATEREPLPERGLLTRAKDFITGDTPKGFPDAPEIGSINLKSTARNAQIAAIMSTATNEADQVKGIENAVPGTLRRRDAHGNLMVKFPASALPEGEVPRWTYVNKPGLSQQDVTQAASQVLQFTPAGRVGRAAVTLPGRMAISGVAAGGTSVIQDLVATALGTEQGVDLEKALFTTAGGGAAEALGAAFGPVRGYLMGAIKGRGGVAMQGGRLTDAGRSTLKAELQQAGVDPQLLTNEALDRIAKDFRLLQAGGDDTAATIARRAEGESLPVPVPQSRGQITQRGDIQVTEDLARQGSLGDAPRRIVQDLDRRSNLALDKNLDEIQLRLTGRDVPRAKGQGLEAAQKKLSADERAMKRLEDAAYEAVRTSGNKSAAVPVEVADDLAESVFRVLDDQFDLGAPDMAGIRRLVDKLDEVTEQPFAVSDTRPVVVFDVRQKKGIEGIFPDAETAREFARAQPGRQFLDFDSADKVMKTSRVSKVERAELESVLRDAGAANDLGALGVSVDNIYKIRAQASNARKGVPSQSTIAAGEIVKQIDAAMEGALKGALLNGDDAAIEAWKKAIGTARQRRKIFKAGDLVETLTEREFRGGQSVLKVAPEDAANYILKRSELGFVGQRNLYRDLVRMRKILGGPKSEGWNAVREEVFLKFAEAGRKGLAQGEQRVFNGTAFNKAWGDALRKDRRLMDLLFTESERKLISQFGRVAQRITSPAPGGRSQGSAPGHLAFLRTFMNTAFLGPESQALLTRIPGFSQVIERGVQSSRAIVNTRGGLPGARAPEVTSTGAAAVDALQENEPRLRLRTQ